jgi:hypothetical protein
MRATTENDAMPLTPYRPNNYFKTPGTWLPEDVQLSTVATTAQGVGRELDNRCLYPLKAAVPIAPAVAAVHHEEIIARVKKARTISSSNACAFPESAISIPMTISLVRL